ncbi:MAG TPA: SigE family RNA polymerase sigma factor [Candidatus Limnocylindrales bacterium]|nr:SigE family RNA polymerase sigma factor [Candidatus Limnocylindrales bacterium]
MPVQQEMVAMVEPMEAPANPAASGAAREAAFRGLVGARLDHAYRLAYHLLGDPTEAEDACQDALLAAWRAWPRLRDHASFEAWFDRIVANGCLERLRRRGRRPTVRLTEIAGPSGPPALQSADPAPGLAEHDAIGRALERLSPEQRAVVVLRYWSDLTTEQTADRLGIAPGTVRSRLHYALANLRRALDQHPEGGSR